MDKVESKSKNRAVGKKFLSFFDDKSKGEKTWLNRNYFYIGTIGLILLQIILFAALGKGWSTRIFDPAATWENFRIGNFFNALFGSFDHVGGWDHLLGNMIGLFFAGFYLERKFGTIKFTTLALFLTMFSRLPSFLIIQGVSYSSYGFSSAEYALYAVVILDYLTSLFRKKDRNLTNIIVGIITLIYMYIFSWCYGGNGFIDVTYYPKGLIENTWHWSGFICGILTWILLMIFSIKSNHKIKQEQAKNSTNEE